MDLEEPYMQEGETFEHYVVFSKALSDKPLSPIGNRNLNIKHSEEEDTLSITHLKEYLISHIEKLDIEKDAPFFKYLRSKVMPADFHSFEIKPPKMMLSWFEQGKYDVNVLKCNGKVWAYFILFKCKNEFCMLDYFAVNKALRNIGLGGLLLEQIIKIYKNIVIELEPFDLNDENNINTRRFRFYQKFSFKLTDLTVVLRQKYQYMLAVRTDVQNEQNLNKKINELYGEVYNENQFKIKKS